MFLLVFFNLRRESLVNKVTYAHMLVRNLLQNKSDISHQVFF